MNAVGRVTEPIRPVLTRDEAIAVGRKIMEYSSAATVLVRLMHHATGTTRISPRGTCASSDGETIGLTIETQFGGKAGVWLSTNQIDDASLRTIVPYVERLAKRGLALPMVFLPPDVIGPRTYEPVRLWHARSIDALAEERAAPLSAMLDAGRQAQLRSSVFVGVSARATCVMDTSGVVAYGEETDTELTATCWTADFKGSGWSGHASRDWGALDPAAVMREAIDIANRSRSRVALEPGRRTAILAPAAVAQLVRVMTYAFSAESTIVFQNTPFSRPPRGSRVGERVFDPRINMRSDPSDPDGGYLPFFAGGYPQRALPWIERGVLTHLAYTPGYAAVMGQSPAADIPHAIRLEAVAGSESTVDAMIAGCKEGVYVNRFSDVSVLDQKTGMLSGLTRDGCFLVKNGKVQQAVKNFRFVESPWFILNRLEALGVSHRAALGYTPGGDAWPLPPIIVPPLMVRDFHFSGLADAV